MHITQQTINEVSQIIAQDRAGSKMSDRDRERLRAQNTVSKVDKEQTQRVLDEFRRLPKTVPILTEVLARIIPKAQCCDVYPQERLPLKRMAQKLIWSLQQGWEPMTVHDIVFLSELTKDEAAMSDQDLASHLGGKSSKQGEPKRVRRKCQNCGRTFYAERRSAKFCSDACKMKAQRLTETVGALR